MAGCWEKRGCDEEMQSDCAHSNKIGDRCPSKCAFAHCDRPTNVVTTDPELLFDLKVDRDAVVKENCMYCEFFLKNGPRL